MNSGQPSAATGVEHAQDVGLVLNPAENRLSFLRGRLLDRLADHDDHAMMEKMSRQKMMLLLRVWLDSTRKAAPSGWIYQTAARIQVHSFHHD